LYENIPSGNPGDQIGPIFGFWEIVYSAVFFENCRSSPNFWDNYFHGKSCEFDFDQKCVDQTHHITLIGSLLVETRWLSLDREIQRSIFKNAVG
jgi:hypothetical protein